MLAALVVAVVAALPACAPDETASGPERTTSSTLLVPPVSRTPRSTLPTIPPRPDTRGVALPELRNPVLPEPTPPLEIYGGDAELSGSLGYGGEPVAGATVRLERWVDGASTFVELTTGPGGGWLAEDIQGGRYVIRAWKGQRLVLEQASAVFLAEDEERAVHLAMVEAQAPEPEKKDDDEDADEVEDEDDEDDDTPADDEDTTSTTAEGERDGEEDR